MNVLTTTAILCSAALASFHLGLSISTSTLKRMLFIGAVILLSFGLGETVQMALACSFGGALLICLDEPSNTASIRKFILVSIALSGNWLDAGIPEHILLFLLVGLYFTEKHDSDKAVVSSLLILWCLSLVALIIDHSGAFPGGKIELVTSCLLITAALAVSWLDFGRYSSLSNAVLMLLYLCIRLSLEKRTSSLNLDQVATLSNIFTLSYLLTVGSVVLRGIRNGEKDMQSFSVLFAMSLLLPFSPDLMPATRTTFDYSIIGAAVGVALLTNLLNDRLDDAVLKVLFGIFVVSISASAYTSIPLSRASYLGLVLTTSGQLFFLLRGLNSVRCFDLSFRWERMLHYIYLLVIFGGLATLWYILNYVRQIQS